MNRTLTLAVLATSLALAPFAGAQKREARPETITADQLRAYLEFIASDELEGRDTPSRGLDTAAKFIASHLERWGLKPAGTNGTFFQRIELARTAVNADGTQAEFAGKTFRYGDDLLTSGPSASVSAPIVWGGHGWRVKSKNIDAYAGVDPKGKIVVLAQNAMPPGMNFNDLRGLPEGDAQSPADYARERGAVGIAFIYARPGADAWNSFRSGFQRFAGGGRFQPQRTAQEGDKPLPTMTFGPSACAALFDGTQTSADAIYAALEKREYPAAFEMPADRKLTLTVNAKTETRVTQNVVAVWEGSDPKLKEEYVALGAHYDHVGTQGDPSLAPAGRDVIFNGADDDGSGTVALMGIAEALSQAQRRPKRSTVFVWHCGEEKGLWGSEYFVNNPTVPLDKITTQLNIDMIGRSRASGDTTRANANLSAPDEVYVIGSRMMSSELGDLSDRVNANYLKLRFNFKYDDLKDPNRFFYRSDHYNYARKGVPIIFYFDGVHEDYHRVSDQVEKIDFVKMERVTRTVYQTLWELAERKQRVKIDKPLPQ